MQVKRKYDAMLAEMASFCQEREQWQASQSEAEQRLAADRERFEADARAQVGADWRRL